MSTDKNFDAVLTTQSTLGWISELSDCGCINTAPQVAITQSSSNTSYGKMDVMREPFYERMKYKLKPH